MNAIEFLEQADIEAWTTDREAYKATLAEYTKRSELKIKALDAAIGAARLVQSANEFEAAIESHFGIAEPTCEPVAAAEPVQAAENNSALASLSLSDHADHAVEYLRKNGAASSMTIGSALGLSQPKDMDAILKAFPEVFTKANGFWRLK